MHIIYLDGQYLKVSTQIIEAFTPGSFRARGVFETMLGLDGVVLDIDLHLERLHSGLKVLSLKAEKIHPSVLKEVLRRNGLSQARVRLMVWQAGDHVHIMAAALALKSPPKIFRACLIKTKREADTRLANVKSLDYGLFADALTKARGRGFDEALLLNRRGHIFEASRANIFWIKDKVLYTPPLSSGCLNGITRRQVIAQAKKLKIAVKEKNLTPEILEKAEAVFLTNSLIGLKPATVNIRCIFG